MPATTLSPTVSQSMTHGQGGAPSASGPSIWASGSALCRRRGRLRRWPRWMVQHARHVARDSALDQLIQQQPALAVPVRLIGSAESTRHSSVKVSTTCTMVSPACPGPLPRPRKRTNDRPAERAVDRARGIALDRRSGEMNQRLERRSVQPFAHTLLECLIP